MLGKKDFEKIEKALGFKLYDWQKRYIRYEIDVFPSGRGNGKTLAFALRQLLTYEVRMPFPKSPNAYYSLFVCDRNSPKSYTDWYVRYVYDLGMKLDANGIETMFIFKKE